VGRPLLLGSPVTAILAAEHARGVVVGTDSRVTVGDAHFDEDAPKWCLVGPALCALAGGARAALIAEGIGSVRAPRRGERPQVYLSLVIAEAIRQGVEHARAEHDIEGVIAYRGRAYYLDCDYGVMRPTGGVVGAGSGGLAARAAALALADEEPQERVRRALEIAAVVCPGVGGRLWVRDVRRR